MSTPQEILDFWFGAPGEQWHGRHREIWFKPEAAFDAEIRRRFSQDYADAAAGRREEWLREPQSCLAYILLLDQFPRNMFRGDARAWATDGKALAAAQLAIERGFDKQLDPHARKFLYMPYMHSESLADQKMSVSLFRSVGDPEAMAAALRHLEIIERFGRFPHRNAVLGRRSTPEEDAFLLEPNSSF